MGVPLWFQYETLAKWVQSEKLFALFVVSSATDEYEITKSNVMFQDISGLFLQQCVIWMLECQNCWLKQNWVAKEWKLDIDLKLTGTLPETSNILHFLVPGSNGEHGWRIPAIFCRKNKPILDIYSSVGDNHVHSYKTKELNLYQWYSFRWFSIS